MVLTLSRQFVTLTGTGKAVRVFFFSLKCSLFHNANLYGSCIIHILYTGCAKIKKNNNSGAKGLT